MEPIDKLTYAEIVVNVPIRRTFARRYTDAPPVDDADVDEGYDDDGAGALKTYHYHIPPELEGVLAPGHLVWAPFGSREVQGFVLRLSERAPMQTKPVLRLARAEPVLSQVQIQLAEWIAQYYVAPASETLRLFLPPGLLARKDGESAVKAKRELLIEWIGGALDVDDALKRLGKETQSSRTLAYLIEQTHNGHGEVSVRDVQQGCGLASFSPIKSLADKGYVARINPAQERWDGSDVVALSKSTDAATTALWQMRNAAHFAPVLEYLRDADGAVWRSELYSSVDANAQMLRSLRDAGLVRLREEVRYRDPLRSRVYAPTQAPPLTDEQTAVWEQILAHGFNRQSSSEGGRGSKFLIHGVTGSGKTEIYLRAIQEALERGRQAIALVPEIALTPQTVARFAGRFPGRVTVIHSGLSAGERYDVWRMLRQNAYDVVVGPRSALFAPLKRLGLIILDEEHEPSYKQDAEQWGGYKVFFDARRTARRLAELSDSVLIFGSATPSLESYYSAQRGEMALLQMPRRIIGHGERAGAAYADLPPVEVVDMRQELHAGNRSVLSRLLQAELLATLEAKEQAILFLNRRGTNTFVMCRDCGAVAKCTRCDAPLTYHGRSALLICHHCNRRYPEPTECPACGSKRIKYFGAGTQRIVDTVLELAAQVRVLRWDADTTTSKGSHEEILARFANHEADVLVGTQMIAKGLDLPLVTLVGVVAADVALHLPDFRSGERTFQLLTQVAGRAGRGMREGRVVVQTYNPEHYAVQAAAGHNYEGFYSNEIAYRQELGYPPIQRMARLILWEKNADKAESMAEAMGSQLQRRIHEMGLRAESQSVVGPTPAYFGRVRGYYRWQLLLRYDDPASVLQGMTIPFGWRVDVDPVSVL